MCIVHNSYVHNVIELLHNSLVPPTPVQIQWVGWMDGMPTYVVDPSARFSDIIVPTMDTVRAHFMLELLLSNWKPVRSKCSHPY